MAIRIATKPIIIDESPPSPTSQTMDYALKRMAGRGRPASGKKRVTLLIDPDVIEKFRATGPGWQARMNDALKAAKV